MTNKTPVRKHTRQSRVEGSSFTMMKRLPRAWSVIVGVLFAIANLALSPALMAGKGSLIVQGGGNGDGTVTGSEEFSNINCVIMGGTASGSCQHDAPNTIGKVTATWDANSTTFAGWTHAECFIASITLVREAHHS